MTLACLLTINLALIVLKLSYVMQQCKIRKKKVVRNRKMRIFVSPRIFIQKNLKKKKIELLFFLIFKFNKSTVSSKRKTIKNRFPYKVDNVRDFE